MDQVPAQIQDGPGLVKQEARSVASADLVEEEAEVVVEVVAEVVVDIFLQTEISSQNPTLDPQSLKPFRPLLLLRQNHLLHLLQLPSLHPFP